MLEVRRKQRGEEEVARAVRADWERYEEHLKKNRMMRS
jgi:hypothetical protein